MELKVIFTSTEPSTKNALWLSIIDGTPVFKVYTAKGWQVIGNSPTQKEETTEPSLFEKYKNSGGKKTENEFYNELFELLG